MDENVDAALRFAALQLALVTAAIHLWIGWGRLSIYIQAGTPFIDPLQVLFVLSSLGVLGGVALAAWGVRRDYVYALGVVLMLCYLVGWLLMGGHRTGGALIAPAWETTGHTHGSALGTLVEHLFGNTLLLVSKVVEATALGILLVLLYGERSTAAVNDQEPGETAAPADGGLDAHSSPETDDRSGTER